MGAPDLYRWISLTEAYKLLPMRESRARELLRQRGLVKRIDEKECVWLPDLVEVDDESWKKRQAAAAAGKPGSPPVGVTPLPSDDELAP